MDTIKRVHRDIFPHTDHGYTWVESYWYERAGERVSAISPSGGCTERLGHLPGPIPRVELLAQDDIQYCGRACPKTVRSEQTHEGFHRVGSVCIVPA